MFLLLLFAVTTGLHLEGPIHECLVQGTLSEIHRHFLCDGATNCDDRTDESDYCKDCTGGFGFVCNNGKMCVRKDQMCDGKADCGDASDELGTLCNTTETNNRTCDGPNLDGHRQYCFIPAKNGYGCAKTCDGEVECYDALDEENCTTTTGDRDCLAGTGQTGQLCGPKKDVCVSAERWKDNLNQCGTSYDDLKEQVSLSTDPFVCDKGKEEIKHEHKCDAFSDCPDHSDELLQCYTGRNGSLAVWHCARSSFILVKAPFSTEHGYVPLHQVVPRYKLCDGAVDCENGLDEVGCPWRLPNHLVLPIIIVASLLVVIVAGSILACVTCRNKRRGAVDLSPTRPKPPKATNVELDSNLGNGDGMKNFRNINV